MDVWSRYGIELDHLVVAASSLDAGEAWLSARFGGIRLSPGGAHQGFGTHNRLLQLGGGAYLELIAPDPSQADPGRAQPPRRRPFHLDAPDTQAAIAQRPRLVHFVMRCRDLDGALATLPWDTGRPISMTRGSLAWRICVRAAGMPTLPGAAPPSVVGILPTLIDWGTAPHPTSTLESRGALLRRLRVGAPPGMLAALQGIEADPRIVLHETREPMLGVELDTPAGGTVLD